MPASAGPLSIGDPAVPLIHAPLGAGPDVSDTSVQDLRDPMPSTCAQRIGDDQPAAAADSASIRFDLQGNVLVVPGPISTGPPSPAEASKPDAPLVPSTPSHFGEGAFFVAGLLNCSRSTGTSVDGPGPPTPAVPQVSERVRAAVQAGAMTASLVLLIALGYLVAVMVRSSRHPSFGHGHRRR